MPGRPPLGQNLEPIVKCNQNENTEEMGSQQKSARNKIPSGTSKPSYALIFLGWEGVVNDPTQLGTCATRVGCCSGVLLFVKIFRSFVSLAIFRNRLYVPCGDPLAK